MSRRRTRRRQAELVTDSPDAGPAPSPPRGHAPPWLLALVTVLLPFMVLGLTEAGLRVAGYGRALEPVFIDAPTLPGWRQANPRAVLRLFADPAAAPAVSIETGYFRAGKPRGALRIVVQGESSAAGFPYGLGASLAGVLEQRLRRAWPEREVEVVSTALAAVNSYALLDFAEDILAEDPDAIVIYVGHNEYLGILGVGSTLRLAGSPWITRAALSLREWRLYQLAQALLPRGKGDGTGPSEEGDTLMAHVAGERSIPLGSPTYRRGLAQFEHNLDALLAKYQRARVPVFIGTLAANERDQRPFAGAVARDTFEEAGRLLAAGDPVAARRAYLEAKDLDELRFRAPEDMNAVIRAVAMRRGAQVVESQARLLAASEHGIIGADLMLEHVHPNLDGYFLLADAFHDALVASGVTGPPAVVVDDEVARREMPVTEVDRWLGEYKVAKILGGWPFRKTRVEPRLPPAATEGERLAQLLYHERVDWPTAQDRLRRHYRDTGDPQGFAHVTQVLADALPAAGPLQFECAAALVAAGRPHDALRYARRATAIAPGAVDPWLVLGHALALVGRDDEAIGALTRALELEPANVSAREAIDSLRTGSRSPGA